MAFGELGCGCPFFSMGQFLFILIATLTFAAASAQEFDVRGITCLLGWVNAAVAVWGVALMLSMVT